MKNEITVSLTNSQLEVAAKIVRSVCEVMNLDEQEMVWRADYESFILNLSGEEMCALQELCGKF